MYPCDYAVCREKLSTIIFRISTFKADNKRREQESVMSLMLTLNFDNIFKITIKITCKSNKDSPKQHKLNKLFSN